MTFRSLGALRREQITSYEVNRFKSLDGYKQLKVDLLNGKPGEGGWWVSATESVLDYLLTRTYGKSWKQSGASDKKAFKRVKLEEIASKLVETAIKAVLNSGIYGESSRTNQYKAQLKLEIGKVGKFLGSIRG